MTTVTAQESEVMNVLRDEDHVNGDVRLRRSGGSGAGGALGFEDMNVVGEGSGVSNVR